jgi:hypothetical protein
MHLSNQLRGKRFPSDQLVLFDDSMNQLPVEVQEKARAVGINLIGFDFTVPQQQAFEAALSLINASGRKQRIRIKPEDWIRAYQLRRYEHREGYQFQSPKQREEAFKALLVLGMKPFLMYYHKMEGGREMRETRIAPLWRLGFVHLAAVPEAKKIEDVTTDYIRNLFERIRLSLDGPFDKIPASLHPFLEWVFAEAGRLRNQQKGSSSVFSLRADWHEVALQSRLHGQFEKRNIKRAREMLTRNGVLAQKAGILRTFSYDGSLFTAEFNPQQFEELERYLQERRRQPVKGRAVLKSQNTDAPPWNPAKLSPFQLMQLVKDWKHERERLKSSFASEEDKKQIRKLTAWIRSFEGVYYGRQLTKN